MARVTTIPATINRFNQSPITQIQKRKVAGYARVSTDSDEQQTSYEAQVNYYENYIKNHEDWEFVSVYTDEGISGTSTKHREGFNTMIADALDGKIDLIITKSVSRFARNTVDSLTTIRKLKEVNCECYFEKENIWTFDGKGELLLTIMSSLAQEESRSISENVKWGHRKRFADGKVTVPFSRFLGYKRGEDGNLVVDENEAIIVKRIYRLFLEGFTAHRISRLLTEEKILSPGGKEKWNAGTVRSILRNEKYKGDALLQKSYTVDFLTKKKKINEGEIPQYYVQSNHEGIISPEVFEMVQKEMTARLESKSRYSGVDMFSSKIHCGECGSFYGSKVWHSNTKYRRVIFQCNHKFKNESKCSTPHFTEDEIKAMFVVAINKLLKNKAEIISNIQTMQTVILDNTALNKEKETIHAQMIILVELIEKMIEDNARKAQDQALYQEKYNKLVQDYDLAKDKYNELENKISDNLSRKEIMEHFIHTLKKQKDLIVEFDSSLWGSLLDYITVYDEKDVRFMFRNGSEVKN